MNSASICGMRGCYLSTDKLDRYLFVGGWHDGKVTVMRLNEDGTIGEMTDEVFHKGIGSVAVNAAKQCAKARQADALRLFVVEDNTPAIRLYEKNGFIRARGIYHEIIDDALTLQEVGYEKALFR